MRRELCFFLDLYLRLEKCFLLDLCLHLEPCLRLELCLLRDLCLLLELGAAFRSRGRPFLIIKPSIECLLNAEKQIVDLLITREVISSSTIC
jgi:hypothetical protein